MTFGLFILFVIFLTFLLKPSVLWMTPAVIRLLRLTSSHVMYLTARVLLDMEKVCRGIKRPRITNRVQRYRKSWIIVPSVANQNRNWSVTLIRLLKTRSFEGSLFGGVFNYLIDFFWLNLRKQ